MIYGYARCSTNEQRQDIDRQKRDLRSLGVDNDQQIYWEYESGSKENRPELNKLLNIISKGDTICATEVSRLTRSTSQLCDILKIIQDKKIRLIIGSFIVDCRSDTLDPMTKGMLMMWGVFSEMERDMISQRVKSGMANAKAKGSVIGRPIRTKETIPSDFWKYYVRYKQKELSVSEISRITGTARSTIYRYIQLAESNEDK